MTAVGLLVAAVVLLFVGGFIQFDDIEGTGYDDWIMPMALVALIVASLGMLVAFRDREQRRPVGVALGVLVAAVVFLALTDDGFRFIWHASEGELYFAAVVAT